jgi:pSer/pThr/pTyr-binding forkhead associated (FHA) protein
MSAYSLDEFLGACGASGPLRLTLDDGSNAVEYVLPQPFAVVGSDPRADIRLATPNVPRRAVYLQILGGRLLCVDLAGISGGRGEKHPHHQWLDPGHACTCGSISFRMDPNNSGLPGPAPTARSENVGPASVEISGGSSGVCRYRLKDRLVLIGKSSQCQVRLRDAAVSRFHCSLIHTPTGLWVLDLLGRGGISVNGISARHARMDDGDELRVGGFIFRPRFGTTQELVPREAAVTAPVQIANVPLHSMAVPNALPAGMGNEIPPLLSFFATLQQQMAEQFRLTMTGVVESFQRMQDNQMRLVFEEMAQIRRLTEELISLKSNPVQSPVLAPTTARVAAPTVKPADEFHPAANKNNGMGLPTAKVFREISSARTPAVGEKSSVAPSQLKPDSEVDVHAWVNRRVAEIQRERDGRWQRIFSFLTGATS